MTNRLEFDEEDLEERREEIFMDVMRKLAQAAKETSEYVNDSMSSISKATEEANQEMENAGKILMELYINNKTAREMRGDAITSIIILEEVLEEILLEIYVKKGMHNDFRKTLFREEGFSIYLKYKLVKKSGKLDKNTASSIETLIRMRNIFAHSKFTISAEAVQLFYKWDGKNTIKDIKTFKEKFDELFKDTINELYKVLEDINKNYNSKSI